MEVNVLRSLEQPVLAAWQSHLAGLQGFSNGL